MLSSICPERAEMMVLVGTYVLSTAPVFAGVIWMMARMTRTTRRNKQVGAFARNLK